jgi:DNA repair protein RAD16
MQNRVAELYSLVRFMRIFPYAYYLCKQGHRKDATGTGCGCISLDHPFKKDRNRCDNCGYAFLDLLAISHACMLYLTVTNVMNRHA